MRYEERPNAEIKILGENTYQSKSSTNNNWKIIRKNPYGTGKFEIVEVYNKDNVLIAKSELSGTQDKFEYRTVTYFETNGNVYRTITYLRNYDELGNLISEEIQNE